jgi:hypothetical protein
MIMSQLPGSYERASSYNGQKGRHVIWQLTVDGSDMDFKLEILQLQRDRHTPGVDTLGKAWQPLADYQADCTVDPDLWGSVNRVLPESFAWERVAE